MRRRMQAARAPGPHRAGEVWFWRVDRQSCRWICRRTDDRAAAAQPGADARIRQNLALVVGLQGRFDEAKSIATSVLSPDEAQANTAYLKQMLSQRNTWSELRAEPR